MRIEEGKYYRAANGENRWIAGDVVVATHNETSLLKLGTVGVVTGRGQHDEPLVRFIDEKGWEWELSYPDSYFERHHVD